MTGRVNAHWRAETEQGHRAVPPPLPDGETPASPPPRSHQSAARFPSTDTRRETRKKLGVGFRAGFLCLLGEGATLSGRTSRGSPARFFSPPVLFFFEAFLRRFVAGFAPDSGPDYFLPHPPQKKSGVILFYFLFDLIFFSRRSRVEKPPLLSAAVGSRILWITAPGGGRAPPIHGENCARLSA